jgi:hypothetical protein
MIQHITSIDNVVDGKVYDPTRVKHGVVAENRIGDLSWWIDPATHLNLDLPGNLMNRVLVASRLEVGSRILTDGGRFTVAPVDPAAYRWYGKVDPAEQKRRIRLRPQIRS